MILDQPEPVSLTATDGAFTQMVAGAAGAGTYRLALNPAPAQAFATPQVAATPRRRRSRRRLVAGPETGSTCVARRGVARHTLRRGVAATVNGFVVGATVTSGGSGYVTPPTVNIVGGGGTNATALAQISGGVVTNLFITDAGSGYTNPPTIRIAQPPAAAVSPVVLPVMRLDSAMLAPYHNYQIQFMPALGGTWVNWAGGLFTPTDVTNSQFLFITNDVGFFRVLFMQ